MKRKKISVIIPVYNVAGYLSKCLDSVTGQTYRNLEIIVVDDGSTDGSAGICDEYAGKDSRIIVIHQKNRGLSAARNAGLEIMTGEFVGFVDSDDWIDLDYYEQMANRMEETGADIVMTGFYWAYRNREIKCRMYPHDAPYDGLGGLKALSGNRIYHVVWNKLYRKELFDGLLFADGRNYEDVLISYRLILRSKHIECLKDYGYHQTMRDGSINHCPGSAAENFTAHYDWWRDIKRRQYKEGIPEETIQKIFIDTAEMAYRTVCAECFACRREHPEEFKRAESFWKRHKWKIAKIRWKYWIAARFPFIFKAVSAVKVYVPGIWNILRSCRKIFRRNRYGELFGKE